MKLQDDMTLEECREAAIEARRYLGEVIEEEIPPTTQVVYEYRTLMTRLENKWWVAIYAKETLTGESSITLLPFSIYFKHNNDMLTHLATCEGEKAALEFLASQGFNTEIVSDDETTGEDSPTIN